MTRSNILDRTIFQLESLSRNTGPMQDVTLEFHATNIEEARAIAAALVLANNGERSTQGDIDEKTTLTHLMYEHKFHQKPDATGVKASIKLLEKNLGGLRPITWQAGIGQMLEYLYDIKQHNFGNTDEGVEFERLRNGHHIALPKRQLDMKHFTQMGVDLREMIGEHHGHDVHVHFLKPPPELMPVDPEQDIQWQNPKLQAFLTQKLDELNAPKLPKKPKKPVNVAVTKTQANDFDPELEASMNKYAKARDSQPATLEHLNSNGYSLNNLQRYEPAARLVEAITGLANALDTRDEETINTAQYSEINRTRHLSQTQLHREIAARLLSAENVFTAACVAKIGKTFCPSRAQPPMTPRQKRDRENTIKANRNFFAQNPEAVEFLESQVVRFPAIMDLVNASTLNLDYSKAAPSFNIEKPPASLEELIKLICTPNPPPFS